MPPEEMFERGSDGLYDFRHNPAYPGAVPPPIIDGDGEGMRSIEPPFEYNRDGTSELTFTQGEQPSEVLNLSADPDDNVTFLNNSIEIMKIDDLGIHVHGHLAVEDKEIYLAFLEWLNIGRMENGLPPVKPKIPYAKPTFTRYDAIKGVS